MSRTTLDDKINTPPTTKKQRLLLLQKLFQNTEKINQALSLLKQIKRPIGDKGVPFEDIHSVSLSEMYDIKEKLNFTYSVSNIESVIFFRHDGEDARYDPKARNFEITTFRLLCVGENWKLACKELEEVENILKSRKDKVFEPVIQGLDRQNFRWGNIKILFNGTHIKVSQGGKDIGEYDLDVLKMPKLSRRSESGDTVSVRKMFMSLFILNEENKHIVDKNISNKNQNLHKQKERLSKLLSEAFGTYDKPFTVQRPNKKTAGTYVPIFQTGLYGDLEEKSVTFSSGVSGHKQTETPDWSNDYNRE